MGVGVAGWAGGCRNSHAKAVWCLGVGGRGLLGSCHRFCSGSPAPSLESAKSLALGTESPLFRDRSDFFDYSDSDQARLLAVAQFIGEKPVIFVNSGSGPGFFHRILVGALVVAFFFLLFQFCTHM
ncbi:fertilization-influencing membrane protein [Hipposideros larvatus]